MPSSERCSAPVLSVHKAARYGTGWSGLRLALIFYVLTQGLAHATVRAEVVTEPSAHDKASVPVAEGTYRSEAEWQALEARLQAAKDAAAQLEATLSARDAEIAALTSDRDELASSLRTLQSAFSKQKRLIEEGVVSDARDREAAAAAQERLEAEKAAVERALEQANADIAKKRSIITAKEAAHAQAAEEAAQRLGEREAEGERLRADLEQSGRNIGRLETRLQTLEETHTGALAAIDRLQDKLDVNRRALADAEAQLSETRQALVDIQSRLPENLGGRVTADQAREAAAGRMAALRGLYDQRASMTEEAWQASVRDLERQIQDQQQLLGQALSATTLYRVQPSDTLGKVSARFYGRSNRWSEIFEANRHLLQDPDRVLPGMTLIIP